MVPTSFTCSSALTVTACNGPDTLDTATPGNRVATFSATDQFGLTTTVDVPYVVDGTPPQLSFGSGPPVIGSAGSATFQFTGVDPDEPGFTVLFTCQLDDAVPEPCTSPYTATVPTPIDGVHTFTIEGRDRVGNTDSISYQWEIDTAAPMFQSFIGPADPSLETTATFAYLTDGPATVTCTLDGVSKPCTATGATITGLTPRAMPYVFRATATDAAGNTSTVEHSWHVYAGTELIASPVLPTLPKLTATLTTLAGSPVAGQKVTFRRGTAGGGGVVPCSGAAADGSVLTAANGVATCNISFGELLSVVRQRWPPGDLRHHAAVPRQPRQCRGAVNQPTGRAAGAAGEGGAGLSPYVSALHGEWLREERDQPWDEVPGTLVFADVSGFTPLAERLARRGKVGAEELTDTLNLVFTRLLEVAGRFGGDCLKFGGDALLIVVPGTAPRPARGRRRARDAGRPAASSVDRAPVPGSPSSASRWGCTPARSTPSSSGPRTRSSCSWAPGSTAPSSSKERPPAARSSSTSRPRASSSPSTSRSKVPAPSCCDERRPRWWTRARPKRLAVPSTGSPSRSAPHLDGARKDGEHRLASVAFVKYGGTDQLLEQHGPEAVAHALRSFIALVQASCRDHDVSFIGTDVDRDGGKVILASGMPSTSDDDEDRLLLAVQEIVAVSVASPISVRAGMHRGRIFAVDLGSPSRRTFTVMGDAVNLAARVMGHAAWGTVVATDELLERRRTDFHLDPLAPFVVKGKSAPVQAQVVGEPRGRRDRDDLGTPLVGRSAEVAEIRAAFAGAHAGEGRIIELIGEPGIGKSKLVAAMLDARPRLGWLRVRGGSVQPGHAVLRAPPRPAGVDGHDARDAGRGRGRRPR